MKLIALLMLVPLIAVTGCLGFDFGSLFAFGSDVIKVSPITLTEGQKDILTIQDKLTIPSAGNILPDKPVQFSYLLISNDDLKTAENVRTYLFDAPTFRDDMKPGKDRCNAGYLVNCLANEEEQDDEKCQPNKPCRVLPGEEKLIKYNLLSPSEEDIANIRTQPRINFLASYDTKSSLSFVFPIVNFDEIVKRQRAGESVDLRLISSHSSGPIQIDAQLIGENYGLADKPVTVVFRLRDVGSGSVKDSKIEKGKMKIMIPTDFIVTESTGIFEENGEENDYRVFTNNRTIGMLLDESQITMRFDLKLDNADKANPFRSFQILAEVNYTYELRDYMDVTINPFGNI